MKKHKKLFIGYTIALLSLLSLGSCGKGEYRLGLTTSEEKTPDRQTPPEHLEQKTEFDLVDVLRQAKESYIDQFGVPEIRFEQGEEGLRVTIETSRLTLTSSTIGEIGEYHSYLYNSPAVMEKFANGVTIDEAHTRNRFKIWQERWKQGNPFAGLTVRLKDGTFMGHVVLGGGDEPNSSEAAYMIREDQWRQRYGSEAVGALILFYAPAIQQRSYSLLNGQPFERIIATSRQDNVASVKILEHLGFSVYKQSEKFGHTRGHHELMVRDLLGI